MNKKTLENILVLFGNETARCNFERLCREYYGERVRMEAAEAAGESIPNSRRGVIHDEIMAIVQKLFLRSIEVMPSRKEIGKMIMMHFRSEEYLYL